MTAYATCARCGIPSPALACGRSQCAQPVLCDDCDAAVNGQASLANLRRAAARVGGE